MARRSSHPALYEMMQNRAPAEVSGAPSSAAPSRPALRLADDDDLEMMRDDASASPILERALSLLKPGQTVRLPVGYILAACAGIIVLLLVTYLIGVNAGKSIQSAAFQEKFGSAFEITPQRGSVNDPLTFDRPQDQSASGGTPASGRVGIPPAGGAGRPDGNALGPPNWGPVVPTRDPRLPGWNYFIVATNPLMARCIQLAEFCRANGLETYVVSHKNGGQVIVFPGYEGPRDAPAVKALEERIHQIGDRYKAANKYETNMRDAYPSKYDG